MVETRGFLCFKRYGYFQNHLGSTLNTFMFRFLFSELSTCSNSRFLTHVWFPNFQSEGRVPQFLPGSGAFETYAVSPDYDWAGIGFWIIWFAFLAWILYALFFSCRNNRNIRVPHPSSNTPRPSSGSNHWFPGDYHHNQSDPPPPYTKNAQNAPTWQNWRPGFWTGAAVGGLANYWWNRPRTEAPIRRTAYDWELVQPQSSFFGRSNSYRQPTSDYDRGEGSSNLGSMRRSTGLGGSSVR